MSATTAAFYFDLASPLAYLAAEQALSAFLGAPVPVEWRPVLARELPGGDTLERFRGGTHAEILRADVVRRAHELRLQPLRWPEPFPFDSELAMRVATYAKSIGRTVPFAQAAFRQAFAGGRSLADPDSVLIAAAACEMHPRAVLAGAELRSTAEQLHACTAEAASLGVGEVPAVLVSDACSPHAGAVFVGERALEEAAAHLRDGEAQGLAR